MRVGSALTVSNGGTMEMSHEQCRHFCDRFGARQDHQRWYEKPALDELIGHSRFIEAGSVFEFGCGTGELALTLLAQHLPLTASYTCVDVSDTMIGLTNERLFPYRDRVTVERSTGTVKLAEPASAHDRFVSAYVLDLLSPDDIELLLSEAHRILRDTGLLCLASLTVGADFLSRTVSRVCNAAYAVRPQLLGGCRPLRLLEFVRAPQWRVVHHSIVTAYCIPSAVLVATRESSG